MIEQKDSYQAAKAAVKVELSDPATEKAFFSDHLTKVLWDEAQLNERIAELGREITRDYKGKDLIVVGLMKGAFMFFADLVRSIDLPIITDIMLLKSYSGTQSTGTVRCLKDLDEDPTGKHVLIAEDLIDTGCTLAWLKKHLQGKGAESVKICCLFDKMTKKKRPVDIPVDYVGWKCSDEFIVGYGMDYDEIYRNIPIVGILHPKIYAEENEVVESVEL